METLYVTTATSQGSTEEWPAVLVTRKSQFYLCAFNCVLPSSIANNFIHVGDLVFQKYAQLFSRLFRTTSPTDDHASNAGLRS